MSLALNPIPTQVVYDPLCNLNEPRIYTIQKGGAQVTWKNILATSYSNSNFTISAPPPSPGILVDRKIYMKMRVSIDIVGTAPPGSLLLQSGAWALRSFPLSRLVNTLQISINNTSCSINMADVFGAFLMYHNGTVAKETEYSMTPTCLDQSTEYSALVNSIRNPLGPYGDSNDGASMGRGGFAPVSSTYVNTNTTAHLDFDLCENLFLSPLVWGRKNYKAFAGVQTFDVTVNWVNDLTRILSLATGSPSTYTSITVNLGQPSLLFKYVTPQLLSSVPRSIEYAYNVVDRYPTYAGTIASGATTQISSSNIQLKGIPRHMYFACRQQNSDLTAYTSDFFLPISQLSMNFNNQCGIFSNMTQFDIYNLCKGNGLNQNWTQFSGGPTVQTNGSTISSFGTIGGVVKVEFAKDIGLSSVEAPGLDGTYQLQINATVTNQSANAVNAMFYIITITEGTWTIENNRSVSQTGVISKLDILNSEQSPVVHYKDLDEMMGGNIFEDIASGLSKGLSWVRENVIPVARDIAPIIGSLRGRGEGEGMYGSGCGEEMGGAHISRRHLRRRI